MNTVHSHSITAFGRRGVVTLAVTSTLVLAACGGTTTEGAIADVQPIDETSTAAAPTDTDSNSPTTTPDAPTTTAADGTTSTTEAPSADASTTSTTASAPTSTESPVPSPLEGLTVRVDDTIRFAPGTSSGTASGAVIRGERDVYRFEADAGQQLNLVITSLEDNGVVDVFDPTGAKIVDESAEADLQLPASGEYLIVVGGTRGNVTYDLTLSIPA